MWGGLCSLFVREIIMLWLGTERAFDIDKGVKCLRLELLHVRVYFKYFPPVPDGRVQMFWTRTRAFFNFSTFDLSNPYLAPFHIRLRTSKWFIANIFSPWVCHVAHSEGEKWSPNEIVNLYIGIPRSKLLHRSIVTHFNTYLMSMLSIVQHFHYQPEWHDFMPAANFHTRNKAHFVGLVSEWERENEDINLHFYDIFFSSAISRRTHTLSSHIHGVWRVSKFSCTLQIFYYSIVHWY